MRADDGVLLHVEVDGLAVGGAAVTVLFCHGFAARLEEYDLQRDALRCRARLVLYDQRGHGRSGWGDYRRATIDQLGADLGRVVDECARPGPVVLVGHSMGGMGIMALAAARPELFGPRIVGVGLLATSAGHLVQALVGRTTGRLLAGSGLLRGYLALIWLITPLLERLGPLRTDLGRRFVRRRLFGVDPVPPETVDRMQWMLAGTRQSVATAFCPTFVHHDRAPALAALRAIPALVLCGSADRVTPPRHSRRIAAELGSSAELVVVPGAGHMVNLTHAPVVNTALAQLLGRAGQP